MRPDNAVRSPNPHVKAAFLKLKWNIFLLTGLALLGLLALSVGFGLERTRKATLAPVPSSSSRTALGTSYGKLPLAFELNQGQVPTSGEGAAVRFLARGKGYSLYLTPQKAILSLRQKASGPAKELHLNLEGANPKALAEGLETLPGVSNYYIGNDPSHWHANVPLYAKVKIKDAYPGIDMVYYGNQGKLEYDFIVKPGADPSAIRLAFGGTEGME